MCNFSITSVYLYSKKYDMKVSGHIRLYIVAALSFMYAIPAVADNMRTISSREGISNNSVLSLAQDHNGMVWFGSCDGLNWWDGGKVGIYPGDHVSGRQLSGNLIEEIVPTADSLFWIRTNYGLDLLGYDGMVSRHGQFQGMYRFAARSGEVAVVLTADDRLYGYSPASDEFEEIGRPDFLKSSALLEMHIDDRDMLWVVTRSGISVTDLVFPMNGGPVSLGLPEQMSIPGGCSAAFYDRGGFFILDTAGRLSFYDISSRSLTFLCDVSSEICEHGEVSDIVWDGDDLMLAFLYNGVTRLDSVSRGGRTRYRKSRLDIWCGVFSLLKDRNQDIVWIGTDGQGVIMYAHSATTFTSYTFDRLPYSLSRPVRALEIDSEGTLWVATKGEGILAVPDFYSQERITHDNSFLLNSGNAPLVSETVYAFEESRRGLLWIGSEGTGLNYWSFRDRRMHILEGNLPDDLKFVHGLYESSRDTLWVATVGCGVFRLLVSGPDSRPYVKEYEKMDFGKDIGENNFFFSVSPDADGSILFGNRGAGLVRLDPVTDGYSIYSFAAGRSEIADDVWTMCRDTDSTLWVGTSWGMFPAEAEMTGHRPVQSSVHSILEDNSGYLWASTNRGLVRYDITDSSTVSYGYSYGLGVMEYSDGAAFADTVSNILFFGGTNGFTSVRQGSYRDREYNPPLKFRKTRIGDRISVIESGCRQPSVTVPPGEHLYMLEVSALDYINGSNYVYSYSLSPKADEWIETAPEISLAALSPGKYHLYVKYMNPVTGYESEPYGIDIHVIPYWYSSTGARLAYAGLLMAVCVPSVIFFRRRRRRQAEERSRQMEAARKEEMLESKVQLLEAVAQELSAPLTMISGPCRQILQYGRSDAFVKSHSEQILRQSYKLFDLLSLFRDFSGTGDIEPRLFSVSDVVSKVTSSYSRIAEENGVALSVSVQRHLVWGSDPASMASISDILLSTAFSRAEKGSSIEFSLFADASFLNMSVSFLAESRQKDEIRAVLDRYSLLERLSGNMKNDSFREDLRLAACSSIAGRLGGNIVPFFEKDMIVLSVTLPFIGDSSEKEEASEEIGVAQQESIPYGFSLQQERQKSFEGIEGRRLMYIAGADVEMMNFVADLFSTEFNIRMFRSANEVRAALAATHPDIMVVENMAAGNDAIELVSSVKSDRLTSHIPVILLSLFRYEDDRLKSVESGADICIALPFDVRYLKAVASQLLSRMRSLQNYWQSGVSAYEFTDGKKLRREDKDFIDKLFRIISENISDGRLTTAVIAEKMGMSLRSLYYRLDGLLTVTPSSIIKEYRIRYAGQLLLTTDMSVDEVMDKCGFTNRGTFFRNFSSRYGMTPKAYRQSQPH